jgi:predicted Zn-dependent protease with MMP-like domain
MADQWEHLRKIAEREVDRTLASLPRALRERARALPVTLEPVPNEDLIADGIAADTLGLFTGAEHAEEEHVPLPPQIILFLENLWDFAGQDDEIYREEIRVTLLHELGHYLGLDEEDLIDRGLE